MKAKRLNNIRECTDVSIRNKFTTEFNTYDTPTHITFHVMEAKEKTEKVKRYKDWVETLNIPEQSKQSHFKELDDWLGICDKFACDVDIYWM
jgi:hypothetical protein